MSEESNQDTHIGRDANAANMNFGSQTFEQTATFNYNMVQQKAEPHCPKAVNPPAQFGGREEPLERIIGLLIDERNRHTVAITAVHGMGGIGKTTLAEQIAYEMTNRKLVHAVLWGSVNRQPDVKRILGDWIVSYSDATFDINAIINPMQAAAATKAMLDRVIQEKCEHCEPPLVLVVLDNVWDDGKDAVELLRKALPDNAVILITTRSESLAAKLNARTEKLRALNTDSDEIIAFLRTYLPEELDIQVHDDALRALGKSLGGHALALKLATNRIKREANRSGNTLANALQNCIEDYRRGIPSGKTFKQLKLDDEETTDENLTTSLFYSYEALPPSNQQHFRRLGILPPETPFDTELLAGLWEVEVTEVEAVCDVLRGAALLENTDIQNTYIQHGLLRAYAYALLEEKQEIEYAFAAYMSYIIDYTKRFNELVYELERWHEFLDQVPHIDAVGDGLIHRWQTSPFIGLFDYFIIEFVKNILSYIEHYPIAVETPEGTKIRGQDWLEAALKISENGGQLFEANAIRSQLARIYHRLGQVSKALEYYTQALKQFDILVNLLQKENENEVVKVFNYPRASLLLNISSIKAHMGEFNEALNYLFRALSLAEEVNHHHLVASILTSIGLIHAKSESYQTALSFYERAFKIASRVEDLKQQAVILNNIGSVHRLKNDIEIAIGKYMEALSIFRKLDAKENIATTLNNIGLILTETGEDDAAMEFYEESLELRRLVGDRLGEALTLGNMALSLASNFEDDRAFKCLKEAIAITSEADLVTDEVRHRINYANILDSRGWKEEAINELQYSLSRLEARGISDDGAGHNIEYIQSRLDEILNESAKG
jgi:tetratricopeptide (TPR) repeat protein